MAHFSDQVTTSCKQPGCLTFSPFAPIATKRIELLSIWEALSLCTKDLIHSLFSFYKLLSWWLQARGIYWALLEALVTWENIARNKLSLTLMPLKEDRSVLMQALAIAYLVSCVAFEWDWRFALKHFCALFAILLLALSLLLFKQGSTSIYYATFWRRVEVVVLLLLLSAQRIRSTWDVQSASR